MFFFLVHAPTKPIKVRPSRLSIEVASPVAGSVLVLACECGLANLSCGAGAGGFTAGRVIR